MTNKPKDQTAAGAGANSSTAGGEAPKAEASLWFLKIRNQLPG